MKHAAPHKADPGDVVRIEGHSVGSGRRLGVIVEVLGEAEREHYRVRWEDDAETIFYPGSSDATIKPAGKRQARR
jgi:uncharacterized protein DUF1918